VTGETNTSNNLKQKSVDVVQVQARIQSMQMRQKPGMLLAVARRFLW
jgi:hypothetical protein